MKTVEIKNNFDKKNQCCSNKQSGGNKSMLILTATLVVIVFSVLGIQIMPYFYGGVVGHSHGGGGGCAWPNNCEWVKNF